jgi:hypothetical protein
MEARHTGKQPFNGDIYPLEQKQKETCVIVTWPCSVSIALLEQALLVIFAGWRMLDDLMKP